MNLLNDVAEKAPLTDGKLKIVAPNFAIAAQAIDEGETREVTLVTNKETGTEKGFNSNQVMSCLNLSVLFSFAMIEMIYL